jgi:peptide/nickel transport system ATP-binding protein
MILRAYDPTAGEVWFADREMGQVNIAELDKGRLKRLRRNIQMIFQDPYSSLNPRMRVLDIIGEPLRALSAFTPAQIEARVRDLAAKVGLSVDQLRRYPHAFSGGQRQRICIARALALQPELIVCDEPVSALDVSVRAQIMNLLKDLQSEQKLSYLFIAHDLSIVENISTHVAVMYAGRIVETAKTQAIFQRPRHPYTLTLLQAVPSPDPNQRSALSANEIIDTTPASHGCPFHLRCPMAQPRCAVESPALREVDADHQSACHFAQEVPCPNP